MVDLGVVTAAAEAVSAGQQALQSGKASLSARAATVVALEVLGAGAGATQNLLFGIKSGALGPVGNTRSGQAKSGRQRALDIANALMLQLCKDKALQATASLLSTVNAQRATRQGAAAGSYSINWDSNVGGGRTRQNAAFRYDAVRIAGDLATVIQLSMTLMYGAVAAVHDLAMGADVNDGRGAVVAALLSELEQSQMLDVAAATLLATPPPPSSEVSKILPLLTRAAAAMACSTALLGNLACEAGMYDPNSSTESDDDDNAGGIDNNDAVGVWAGTRHPETLGRLCELLTQPSLARMQRALLERFCRNGGDVAATGEASASAGGSGWRLMDKLRLDSELCTTYDSEDASEPAGVSGQVIALFILALPALSTWAAVCTTPVLHGCLPADLDEQLSRALCATMRLSDGKGDAARGFGRSFGIHTAGPILVKLWLCNTGVRDRCREMPAGCEESIRLTVTPASLEVLARQLEAQTRLGLGVLRVAATVAGGGGPAGAMRLQMTPEMAEMAGQRWTTMLSQALLFWRHRELSAGWGALSDAARADAIQRLSCAGLLPTLEHVLRAYISHAEPSELLQDVMPAANTIMRLFMLPILQLQQEAGGGGGAAAAAAGATAGAGDLRLNLSLLLTLSKAAARLARQLDEATAAAAAHGFSCRAGAAGAAYDKLRRLRHCVFMPYSVFVDFCCGVGPLGYEAGLASLAARPEVVAVSEVAARSAIIAVRSYLASMEAEQRESYRRGGNCVFSRDPVLRRQLAKALELAPACVTAVAAMDPRVVSAQDLLAMQPQQLLADCCRLTLDWARVCDADPQSSSSSRRGGPLMSNPVLAAMIGPDPDGRRGLTGERFLANQAAARLFTALLALAAREDTAMHMAEWLRAPAATGAAGTAAAAPAPPLRQAFQQLLDGAPEWLLRQGALCQRTQMEALMAAAAGGGGGGGGKAAVDIAAVAAATAALRAAARDCLLEMHQLSLAGGLIVAPLAGIPMDAAAVRHCSLAFAGMQAMPLAGLPPAEDAHGERVVPAAPPPGDLNRCALVKMCGNPRCDNFDGRCEAGLPLKKCSRCKAVRYCGAACQQQHWPEHKKLCPLLRC